MEHSLEHPSQPATGPTPAGHEAARLWSRHVMNGWRQTLNDDEARQMDSLSFAAEAEIAHAYTVAYRDTHAALVAVYEAADVLNRLIETNSAAMAAIGYTRQHQALIHALAAYEEARDANS